jgi:adenylosuccinate lyase
MPTSYGGETIGERLTRFRTELARVRESIARVENNGSSFSFGGSTVTQAAYANLLDRQARLEREIAQLESRLAGAVSSQQAVTVTRMEP